MVKNKLQFLFNLLGYKITKLESTEKILSDLDKDFKNIYYKCKNFTMTPPKTCQQKLYSIYKTIEYIVKNNIPGDLAECGVWKGGCCMTMAYSLLKMNQANRKIWLYDTYTGKSQPTVKDKWLGDTSFQTLSNWQKQQRDDYNEWAYAPLDEVKKNMYSTGYPSQNVVFVKGKVEDTIPKKMPKKIALLRLDTDWYESTAHELKHLFPLLSPGGVLIIDDYGTWSGAKQAVDEYFKDNPILLNRIDNTSRLGIKI